MHQTRREFIDGFLGFMGELGDAAAATLAAQELNRALTRVWNKHDWRVYRLSTPYLLTLTANTARYSLQDWVGRVGPGNSIRNTTRSGQQLRRLRDGELLDMFPQAGTSAEVAGQPCAWELAGVSGVHTQPASTGEALEVIGENAADVDVKVSIAGQDAAGRWTRNEVTLNGLVAVAIGTWSYVDELGKSYPAGTDAPTPGTSSRGAVILRKVAGATELQKLFSQESGREHPVLTVYPKPNAADVLALPVIRKPKRLFHDSDAMPDLWEPALFEDLLYNWKVNTGEMSAESAARAPRPALIDLISLDNEQRGPSTTAPYAGF